MGEVDWPNATPLLTGHSKILLITLPNTKFPITLFMLRDTPVSEMLRTPSPFLRTDLPNMLTSNSRELPFHGSTMLLNVRDVSLVLQTKMDPPRLNVVSTLPELKRLLTEICGLRDLSKILKQRMLHLRLSNLASLP